MNIFKNILKSILESSVVGLSKLKGMHFPCEKDYYWKGKLRMLFCGFEKETVSLCKKIIKPGMNIIDVGAHIGYFSILFSKLTGPKGQVFAFEPDPINREFLKKNIKKYKNVTVVPKAVSDGSVAAEFYRDQERGGRHSLLPADFRKEKIKVETVTLDSFVLGIGSPKIDFIKMDIEGWEPRAVAGMRKLLQDNKDIVLVTEFSPDNLSWARKSPVSFLEDLHTLGFNIYAIKNDDGIELIERNNFGKIEDLVRENGSNYINILCKNEN